MNWVAGRQGGDYWKLKIFESKLFKFDIYLLKFDCNAYISGHTDPTPEGYEHHRVNLVLQKSRGVFWTQGTENKMWYGARYMRFRPDTTVHGMVIGGERNYKDGYWLSIGWLRKCTNAGSVSAKESTRT